MKIDPTFETLLQASAVPGQELAMRDFLIERMEPFGTIHKTRWTGFWVEWAHNKGKGPRVVVTAHMDSPGFTVRDINEDGSLDIISLGGIHPNWMHLRLMKLVTRSGGHRGVLHVVGSPQGGRTQYRGLFGFSSKDAAIEAGVQKGDPLSYDSPVVPLADGDLVVAPHWDNRAGIYLLLKILEKMPKRGIDCDVYFAATSCEEVGGRCAAIIGEQIQPDIAICLDVTYEAGSVKMGDGPALTLSDDSVILPTKVRDAVLDIARRARLPVQLEVYNEAGTDASGFREAGNGCLTLPLLLPTLNNHSPCEIGSVQDLENTRKLVVAMLKNSQSLIL